MHLLLAGLILCADGAATEAAKPTMAEYMHGVAMRHRAANRLPAQRLDDDLTKIAQAHANWMAANNTMQHGRQDNIIAYGTTTPEATMLMWMNSPGHRYWMLSGTTRAGWGCQRSANGTWYWCGVFRTEPVAKPAAKGTIAVGGM